MDDAASRLRDEGLDPGSWSNGPGDRYAAHEHGFDKVIVVATGEAIDLEAGDRLELPAGTAHDAIVGGHGVTCLEAHLPSGTLERPQRRGAGEW